MILAYISLFKYLIYLFLTITESIMHYEWNEFAIDDSKPTITAKDGSNITRNEDFSRVNINSFSKQKSFLQTLFYLYF